MYPFILPPLEITVKCLQESFALKIRYNFDAILFTKNFTPKAVFAVLHIFKNRLFLLFIPADNIYKTSFIAKLATHAIF
jgi:hypothetical protein